MNIQLLWLKHIIINLPENIKYFIILNQNFISQRNGYHLVEVNTEKTKIKNNSLQMRWVEVQANKTNIVARIQVQKSWSIQDKVEKRLKKTWNFYKIELHYWRWKNKRLGKRLKILKRKPRRLWLWSKEIRKIKRSKTKNKGKRRKWKECSMKETNKWDNKLKRAFRAKKKAYNKNWKMRLTD